MKKLPSYIILTTYLAAGVLLFTGCTTAEFKLADGKTAVRKVDEAASYAAQIVKWAKRLAQDYKELREPEVKP